jgi:hypothetical protein
VSETRCQFQDLPDAARHAVEKQIGPVKACRSPEGGTSPGVAALLVTEDGTVFMKGVPAESREFVHQARECAASPYVPAASPRLLWYVKAGGWSLVGYEALDGVPPDYRDSEDLTLVLKAISEVQEVTPPADPGVLLTADRRWEKYADPERAHLFAGGTLLHTDLGPDNVLISSDRAHLVDWAWATRGAGFIDPYLFALQLVAAGHQPADAVTWARRLSSWREAPTESLEAFAVAVTRMWREIAHEDPREWKLSMAGRAAELRTYLLTTPWARNCG